MRLWCFVLWVISKDLGNKNMKVSSFESNKNTQRQSIGHIAQFRILNPQVCIFIHQPELVEYIPVQKSEFFNHWIVAHVSLH